MKKKEPWRKLLWVKQPYPDNYVDWTFLSQLKRNSNVQQYSFWTLACDSSVILIHLCSIAMFALAFVGIYNRGWNPGWFAGSSVSITVCGYLLWDRSSTEKFRRATILKSSLLILFTILALSPVLKSLTQSISSDSIWSISCWLCLANICFYDYSYISKKGFKLMLSTNLALAATIVLASRLSTSLSVFCFVLYSIQIFGLLPPFALWVRTSSQTGHWVLLGVLLAMTDTGLFIMGGIWMLIVWIVIQVLVTIVFPGWFLGLLKYKNEIQGPWDPAKPILSGR
jgi:phosphatidylinositol glycan class C protein